VNIQDPYHQLRELFQHVWKQDPWVSPHADVAFEVGEQVGKGGMGSVMRVVDRRLNREAALKMLNSTSDNAIKRFLREAKLTASLDHPSIPPIYEAGRTVNGTYYILLKLVKGETLAQKIRHYHENHCLDHELRELLNIMIRVTEAVSFAHSKGIVHRDLKPENIMVGEFGETLVMDWGIAKDLNDNDKDSSILKSWMDDFSSDVLQSHGLTKSGEIIGTPGFMSPEQAAALEIDERSDVFSLGAILFHLLTDESPVDGDSMVEQAVALQMGRLKSLSSIRPDIPGALQAIVAAALEREPESRTANAGQLLDSLKAFIHEEEVFEHQYSMADRLSQRAKRHPIGLILCCVALALLAIGMFGLSELRRQNYQDQRLKTALSAKMVKNLREALSKERKVSKQFMNNAALLNENKNNYDNAAFLLTQARELVSQGRKKSLVQELMTQYIKKSEGTELAYLLAASVFNSGHMLRSMELSYIAAIKRHPDSYPLLLGIHDLNYRLHPDKKERDSRYLTKLLDTIAKSNLSNEYSELAQGRQAQLSGALASALALYESALKRNEVLDLAYYYRGTVQLELKKYSLALADFNQCLKLNPKHEIYLRDRARAKSLLKKTGAALQDLDLAIFLAPKSAHLFTERGLLRQKAEDWQGSLGDLQRACILDPKTARGWLELGLLREQLDNSQGALEALSKSLAIRGSARGFGARGLLYAELKMTDTALKDYDQAVRLGLKNEDVFLGRAELKSGGEPASAIKDYSSAIALNNKRSRSYYDRALLFSKSGQLIEAKRDMNRAISLGLTDNFVYLQRAVLFLRLDDFESAEKDFTIVIDSGKSLSLVYFNRALIRKSLKRYDDALADLNELFKHEPEHWQGYFERALLFQRKGQSSAAESDLALIIEKSGDAKLIARAKVVLGNLDLQRKP
jgi:serine/threonine protein kinase